jgi:hypothetical protein
MKNMKMMNKTKGTKVPFVTIKLLKHENPFACINNIKEIATWDSFMYGEIQ